MLQLLRAVWRGMASAALLAVFVPSAFATTTYMIRAEPYKSLSPFESCVVGHCANYPPGTVPSGYVTLKQPLASNLWAEYGLALEYELNDGLVKFSSADPHTKWAVAFDTDALGELSGWRVQATKPQNPALMDRWDSCTSRLGSA